MTITQLLNQSRYKFYESGNQALFNVFSAIAAASLSSYSGTVGAIDLVTDLTPDVTVPPTVSAGRPNEESWKTGVDTGNPPTQQAGQ